MGGQRGCNGGHQMSTPSLWKFTQYHESKKVLGMGYWFQMWAAVDVTYIDGARA